MTTNMPLTAADLSPPMVGTPFAASYARSRGAMSPGLETQSERWTAMSAQAAATPTSRLQQLQPSSNGMSARDSQRMLPSGDMLPTENAQGPAAYESGKTMLMTGAENQYNAIVGRQPG